MGTRQILTMPSTFHPLGDRPIRERGERGFDVGALRFLPACRSIEVGALHIVPFDHLDMMVAIWCRSMLCNVRQQPLHPVHEHGYTIQPPLNLFMDQHILVRVAMQSICAIE